MQLHSWPRFIPAEGYKAKSAQGRMHGAQPRGTQEQSCNGVTQDTFNSSSIKLSVKCFLPGKLIRDIVLSEGVLLGTGHLGFICLPYTKIPNSGGKQEFRVNHIVHQFRHSEPLFSVRVVGTFLKFKFPDASQGSTLQACLSKESRLSPVTFTYFCTS